MREDDERIFYSVVVPGFSVIVITGSEELLAPKFTVTDLVIPDSPAENQDIEISANVTNISGAEAIYPATLWMNDTAEDSQTLTVGAGESQRLTFVVRKSAGTHEVRIDRLVGQLSVGGAVDEGVSAGLSYRGAHSRRTDRYRRGRLLLSASTAG